LKSTITQSKINKSIYFSNKEFTRIKKNIFLKSSQLFINPKIYSEKSEFSPIVFLPNLIDEPMLIINNNNKIIVTSNVCTHRGHILANNKLNKNHLVCPYHGRKFNKCGKLEHIPKFKGNIDKKHDLKIFKSIEWYGFILVDSKPIVGS